MLSILTAVFVTDVEIKLAMCCVNVIMQSVMDMEINLANERGQK